MTEIINFLKKLPLFALIVQIGFIGVSHAQPITGPQYRTIKVALAETNQPIKIIDIKVKGNNVKPNEKFLAENDWLNGLTVTVRNESNKAIFFASLDLHFPRPAGLPGRIAVTTISFGNGALQTQFIPSTDRAVRVLPGETVAIAMSDREFSETKQLLEHNGYSPDIEIIKLRLGRVIFDDDSMWYAGTYLHRDPNDSRSWIRGSAR